MSANADFAPRLARLGRCFDNIAERACDLRTRGRKNGKRIRNDKVIPNGGKTSSSRS